MDFNSISRSDNSVKNYVEFEDKFDRFICDFSIVGVKWSQPTTISAPYFYRILNEGSSARARGFGRGHHNDSDESSTQMSEFYSSLLDHCALWKMKSGKVICTAMPYGNEDSICSAFQEMVSKFRYPAEIKMQFLDNKYHYRSSGDYMIAIYCDYSDEEYYPDYEDEQLYRKAVQHSKPSILRSQKTNSYVRDRYVSEYAKRRAKGICQLCNNPAPFVDSEGKPFLETHHIVRLADGGSDSVDNTVALCPNCHRKMHILNYSEDVEKLLRVLEKMQ